MQKTTRKKISLSDHNKSSMLFNTAKGIVKLEHFGNVFIVTTKNVNLFKRQQAITLTEDIIVHVMDQDILIPSGTKGKFTLNRVYFRIDSFFIGLGDEYLHNKTDSIVALC